MTQDRTEQGKFAPKSETLRHVRSIRLTDETWNNIGKVADQRRITRADLIEQMNEAGIFDDLLMSQAQEDSRQFLDQVNAIAQLLINDPALTRNGKDRGVVQRTLKALLKHLESA